MTTTSPASTVETADLEMQAFLQEALGDQFPNLFAKEDLGWKPLGSADFTGEVLPRKDITTYAQKARVMSVVDPLIRRAVSLAGAYVFGQGVTIAAAQEDGTEQDVDRVVQGFMEDPSNQASFTSEQARTEVDRIFRTDGNLFLALPTDRQSGRVQVRRVPLRQVTNILTDPEDADTPWFYLREWTTTVVESGMGGLTTKTRAENRKVLYPDINFRPSTRPKTVDGIPVEWDAPVLHARVNRVDGSPWGTPDLVAALPWAEGYKVYLEDWAKYMKALSRFAYRATSRGRNASTVRDRINSGPDVVGAVAVTSADQKFEAISKSGATIDSESGRPLAAMAAAAVDIPVTMLLGDPGVTGARATAETLDQPMQLAIRARQSVHAGVYRAVLTYVVTQSIKAPGGALRGDVRIDPVTLRERVTLSGDQPIVIRVDWPSLEKIAMETLVKAVVEADGTGLLPEAVVARLLLLALDVDEPDEVMDRLVDPDTGEFINPRQAATDQAGQRAAEAFRRGDDPAEYV